MSVTAAALVQSFSANGADTVYTLTIERDSDTHIKAKIDEVAYTDFTISGADFTTGTVLASGVALVVYRETPLDQIQTWASNTTPAAEDIEAAVDKLTFITQENEEAIDRAIVSPIGSTFGVSTTLGHDAAGDPIGRTATEEVTHLGIGQSVTDAADSADAAAASALAASISAGDAEVVTVTEVAGDTSSYGTSTSWNVDTDFYIGPGNTGKVGNYYQNDDGASLPMNVIFHTDADSLELRIERSSSRLAIFVTDKNGVFSHIYEMPVAGYQNRLVKLVFEDKSTRKVEVRGIIYGFAGVYTEGTGGLNQVWKEENELARKPLLAINCDSYGENANGINTFGKTFVDYLAASLGVRIWNYSSNSTGWSAGSLPIADRATALGDMQDDPDVILMCLGYNDIAETSGDIETAMSAFEAAVSVSLPSVPVVVAGPWTPVGTTTALTTTHNTISTRAGVLSYDYIDIRGWVNGASGNSPTYTDGDNTHPTDAGHLYLAERFANELRRLGHFIT